jgi:transposase
MCALLVGLPDVVVVGVGDWPSWLRVVVTIDAERPTCGCGGAVHRHGVRVVVLVDLPVFGRPARLVWRKQRWRCADAVAAGVTTIRRSPRRAVR